MNNNRVMWAIGGGIAAFFVIVFLLVAVLFVELKAEKEPCVGSCAFVADVRDSGKYSDKTDAEVIEYGNQICNMLSIGQESLLNMLENDETIIESANQNLCPDVVR